MRNVVYNAYILYMFHDLFFMDNIIYFKHMAKEL